MTSEHRPRPEPLGSWTWDWDEALVRLEDFLLAYPPTRALPHLAAIADRAAVPLDFLGGDERARKLLVDAIGARPFATVEDVEHARSHVELLNIEVDVLSGRVRDPITTLEELRDVAARLDAIRRSVERLNRQL